MNNIIENKLSMDVRRILFLKRNDKFLVNLSFQSGPHFQCADLFQTETAHK